MCNITCFGFALRAYSVALLRGFRKLSSICFIATVTDRENMQ